MKYAAAIEAGVSDLGLQPKQVEQLSAYTALLLHWNKRFNLIGRSTESQCVDRHILDSLTLLPHFPSESGQLWIDVGAGAGLPGIPLAISRPDISVHLLDSNGKKTRFMQQAVGQLALSNARVLNCRVEDHHPDKRYDRIVSRAWAALGDGLTASAHLGDEHSRWSFMKSSDVAQELLDVPKQFTLDRQVVLESQSDAPGRQLLEYRRNELP